MNTARMRGVAAVIVTLALIVVTACAPISTGGSASGVAQIHGSILFEADDPLPDNATMHIEVIDPAAGEYPANVVAATEAPAAGLSSPLPFSLPAEGLDLSEDAGYLVSASIRFDGVPLFISAGGVPLRSAAEQGLEIAVSPLAATSEMVGEPAQSAGVVGGRVTWDSGESMPPGSVLVVEIVQTTSSGFGAEPFAYTTLGVDGVQSPIPFELQVTKPDDESNYLIRAQVYQGDIMTWVSPGAERWGTGDAPYTNFDLPIIPIEGAAARAEKEMPASAVLTGTVAYLQKMALPEGAEVDVALVDLGVGAILADANSVTTGEQAPLPFALTYAPSQISDSGQYGLLARIMIDGAAAFATLQPVAVLTQGAPATDVNLVLDYVGVGVTGEGGEPMTGAVTGNVIYHQRIALPPGSVVEVRLQDISRMDAPAQILATQVITTAGEQVPIPFNLPYNPADIDERFTYSVAARITVDGSLAWISDTMTPVITQGNPTSGVEVVVVQVR